MPLRTKNLTIVRTAANARQPVNLKQDMQLTGKIRDLQFKVQGTMTATGGGAISGFTREAPFGVMSTWELSGNFKATGQKRTIFNNDPAEMYWPCNFKEYNPGRTLIVSAGAAAVDPFIGTIQDVVKLPASPFRNATYIDSRYYTTLDFIINWSNGTTAFASTNLASIQLVALDVQIVEEYDTPDTEDHPHFEPAWTVKDHPTTTVNTQVTNDADFVFAGDCPALYFRQHDDSAVGNAERVDGLVRFLSLYQNGLPVIDNKAWSSLLEETQRSNPLAYTTTRPAGVVTIPFMPPLKSRFGNLSLKRDTQSANPPDITDIVAGAGDKIVTVAYTMEANRGMMDAISRAAGIGMGRK